MTAQSELCFVDTNVLVYGFEKVASAKKQIAQRLLTELADRDSLPLSTQVLQELFVTLTRKVSQPCTSNEALSVLESLSVWPIVTIDYKAIRDAIELADEAKLSFWDALVVIAAARSGAKLLYTEDLNDGKEIMGVRICNPFANQSSSLN